MWHLLVAAADRDAMLLRLGQRRFINLPLAVDPQLAIQMLPLPALVFPNYGILARRPVSREAARCESIHFREV